ncbi:MAG: hypothetical protein J6B34_01575 [Clostridia bacterium]|nr:hypothetical protein [Clostridia bacterium]
MKKICLILTMIVTLGCVSLALAGCHSHTLEKTEGYSATCTKDGLAEYYTCIDCGEVFADLECREKTTPKAQKISAVGHISASDDGDCTTSVTCRSCDKVFIQGLPSHTDSNGDKKCDLCKTEIKD